MKKLVIMSLLVALVAALAGSGTENAAAFEIE